MEEGTRTPLSDVIVVATWHGTVSSLAGGTGICFHVESTTTDAKGHYYIPAWKKQTKFARSKDQFVDVIVYKSGYQWPDKVLEKGNESYLSLAKETSGERLAHLSRVAISCSDKRDIDINLLPLYKALYKEAKNLAVTKEDKDVVETLLFGLESLEFDSMTALKKMTQRREAGK